MPAAMPRRCRRSATLPPGPVARLLPPAKAAALPAPRRGRPRGAAAKPRAARRRPQRGTNARLIAEVLKALPSGTGRPADIRAALTRDKGVTMAYTSIRHSLGQLQARGEVSAGADGKTWRYTGS